MFKEVPIINTINMQHDGRGGRGGVAFASGGLSLHSGRAPADVKPRFRGACDLQ